MIVCFNSLEDSELKYDLLYEDIHFVNHLHVSIKSIKHSSQSWLIHFVISEDFN